jgi:hypothetical protein
MLDTMTWIQSILTTTPERWKQMAEALPEDLATRRPLPKEWSARECLYHMIDVESVFCSRLLAFQAGQDFPAFDPDTQASQPDPQRTFSQVAEEFAERRKHSLDMLEQISAQDFDRSAYHQELGPVRLVEMLNEWAAHDLNHTMQAEKALMQPFIQACGPWQIYFEQHRMDNNS